MRVAGLTLLLILGFARAFHADVDQPRIRLDTSFGFWDTLASAIVAVRLESNQPVTIESERYAAHTATVLAVFKKDPRLPTIGESLTLFESPCGLCTEEGKQPPWDPGRPIPAGGQWILFLFWDRELQGFRIVHALF